MARITRQDLTDRISYLQAVVANREEQIKTLENKINSMKNDSILATRNARNNALNAIADIAKAAAAIAVE